MKRFLGLCVILALCLNVTACGLLPKEGSARKAPVNQTAVETQCFSLVGVEKGDVVNCYTANCTYSNQKAESLAFSVSNETLVGVYVKEGDSVVAGQLLAEISLGELEDKYDELLEQSEAINAKYDEYTQKLAFETERKELAARYGRKYDSGNFDNLTLQVNDYTGQKTVTDLKLAELEKEIKGRCLYASFDGKVNFVRQMMPWERTNKNTFITVCSDEQGFITWINEPEFFELGKVYDIETDSGTIPCTLYAMNSDSTISTRYMLIFVPVQPDAVIAEGTNGTVRIILEEAKDVLYIPTGALRNIDGKNAVYIVNADGMRDIRYVEIGLSVSGIFPSSLNLTEIKSGLSEGDKVIIR